MHLNVISDLMEFITTPKTQIMNLSRYRQNSDFLEKPMTFRDCNKNISIRKIYETKVLKGYSFRQMGYFLRKLLVLVDGNEKSNR